MSTILFTAGAKGGTGKSTAARFLITYLREHGFIVLLRFVAKFSYPCCTFIVCSIPHSRRDQLAFSSDLLLNARAVLEVPRRHEPPSPVRG